MKALMFIVATLFVTLILVAAGLGESDQAPRIGWFEVSQH
jgi:hypothetical protein